MNILIIDDEQVVLQTVYQQLVGLKLDAVTHIDVASSATQARELLSSMEYQIFLCDIVMPGEDGISFAKYVLKQFPHSKFIFLTAHADFRYMKEAISINSFDYLLQPAHSQALREVLVRAVQQIQIEAANRKLVEKMRYYQEHEDTLLHGMVSGFLNGRANSSAFVEKMFRSRLKEFAAPENEPLFLCAAYVQRLGEDVSPNEDERLFCRQTFKNTLREITAHTPIAYYVFLEENADALVLLCSTNAELLQENIESYWKSFCILIYKMHALETAIYVGDVLPFGKICGCRESFLYQKQNNPKKRSGVFFSRSIDPSMDIRKRALLWQKLLDEKAYDRFVDSLECMIQTDSERGKITKEYLLHIHEYVTEVLLNYMVNQKIESAAVFDETMPYLQYMNAYRNVDDFLSAIRCIAKRLEKEKTGCVDMVEAAQAFIEENLYRNISVTDVAERVGINQEYLTRLFKKKTGCNLKEYIVKEKMQEAKHLLCSTTLPVTIISSQLGYGSYSNFTHTFKQIFGLTPLECRKQEPDA